MNSTEKAAYKWFIENGFSDKEIDFNRRRSVDFIVLGKPYEVKRIYGENTLYFTEKQFKIFKKIDPIILIFQKDKLVSIYKFSKLPQKYRIKVVPSKYIMIPVFPETKERLMSYGRKGETFDQLLNRLLDEIDELRGKARCQS